MLYWLERTIGFWQIQIVIKVIKNVCSLRFWDQLLGSIRGFLASAFDLWHNHETCKDLPPSRQPRKVMFNNIILEKVIFEQASTKIVYGRRYMGAAEQKKIFEEIAKFIIERYCTSLSICLQLMATPFQIYAYIWKKCFHADRKKTRFVLVDTHEAVGNSNEIWSYHH